MMNEQVFEVITKNFKDWVNYFAPSEENRKNLRYPKFNDFWKFDYRPGGGGDSTKHHDKGGW